MASAALEKLGKEISEKRDWLKDRFDRSKQADGTYNLTKAETEEIQAKNKELEDLGEKYDAQAKLEQMEERNNAHLKTLKTPRRPEHSVEPESKGGKRERKDLGQMFRESMYDGDTCIKGKEIEVPDFDLAEMKTLMETGAGFEPESVRSGKIVLFPTRPVLLPDVLPVIPLNQMSYLYMEETTFDDSNVAETAEGDTFGEAELEFTEQTAPLRKIPVWIPVTDEQLEFVPGAEALVKGRLSTMVWLALENALLNSNGTPPNIAGYYSVVTQTQAKGTDPVFDCVLKGMTKVRVVGRATPTLVVMHPNDWEAVRLTRTSDGIYILGNPTDAGPMRLWGVPVLETDAATEGTGLVGDFAMQSAMLTKGGVTFKVTDSHADGFINGIQAIRAQIYAGLVVFRPAAFCELTGI